MRCIALGSFDGLHKAHMAVLQSTKKNPALQPAVLLFGEHPQKRLCGQEPLALLTPAEREARICAMGLEVLCVAFEAVCALPPAVFLQEVLVGHFAAGGVCCGYDYRFGQHAAGDVNDLRRLCLAHGVELCVTPQICCQGQVVSSSAIRHAVEQGDVQTANAMLGRAFGYAFEVVHGEARGRTLGYPTLNQNFSAGFVLPRFGVYASSTFVDGAWHASVTNIGLRPSFGGTTPRSETFVMGYSGDLYGQNVPVRLHGFVRDEQRFVSLAALCAQIAMDVEACLHVAKEEGEVCDGGIQDAAIVGLEEKNREPCNFKANQNGA